MDKLPNKSLPVWKLIGLQVIIVLLGYWLLSGWVRQTLVKRDLLNAVDTYEVQVNKELSIFKETYIPLQKKSLDVEVNRLVHSLNGEVEETTVSIVKGVNTTPQERIKLIATMSILEIPLLLEGLRRLEYRFSLVGLEVHAYKQPFKIQVRLSRPYPLIDVNSNWIAELFSDPKDIIAVEQMEEWNQWKDFWAKESSHFSLSQVQWKGLSAGLSESLWSLHLQKGSLTYTPKQGITVMPLEQSPR